MLAQLETTDLATVHLVRSVGEAQRPRVRPHESQRELLAHAAAAVDLHRPVEHLQRHVRHGDLDLGDGLLGGLVADGVHHVRGVQDEQPRLVDLDARLRDALERDVVVGDALAEGHAAHRALAHQLQRPLGHADLAHAVVDASGTQAALRDLEAAALAEQQVGRGHPHVLEQHLAVAVRRVVVAEHLQHADHLDARRVARHDDHRLLLVLVGILRIRLAHEDEDLAARVADPRRPPLVAVDDVVAAVADDRRFDVRRVRRRDLGLGHGERRADLALEQRLQPLLLVLLGAVALEDLHVAGVGGPIVSSAASKVMAGRMRGKVALITGAGSGIGAATAKRLAAEGARVACVDRMGERAKETARLISAAGGDAFALETDVTDAAACERMVDQVVAHFAALTTLVNSAGVRPERRDRAPAPAEWERVVDTNLTGTYYPSRAALPALSASGHGAIVNLSSVYGMVGGSLSPAYAASKGAVVNLTRQMAMQWAPGVRVNCVCPGMIETPMTRALLDDPAFREAVLLKYPLQRFGQADEVAAAILYLASDEAAFVTGISLPVDGGYTAGCGRRVALAGWLTPVAIG